MSKSSVLHARHLLNLSPSVAAQSPWVCYWHPDYVFPAQVASSSRMTDKEKILDIDGSSWELQDENCVNTRSGFTPTRLQQALSEKPKNTICVYNIANNIANSSGRPDKTPFNKRNFLSR